MGPKQRELLAQAGWQFNENGALRITAHELQQLMKFNFLSGQDSSWVKQHTLGGTARWKVDNHLIEYLEGNGYISKADSLQLSKMNFSTDTASLFELWEDQRRIAGSSTFGGSGSVSLRISDLDSLQLSLGAEQRKRETLEPTGDVTRATGGARWKHTFQTTGAMSGLSTSLGVTRNSGSGISVEASADRGFDASNWGINGFVRWNGATEKGLAGAGANGAATVGLKVTYAFGKPPSSLHTGMATALPASTNQDETRNEGTYRNRPDPMPAGENSSPTAKPIPMVFEFVRERADYNPRRVQVSVDETALPIKKVSVNKAGLPAGSTISASGYATLETGVALGTIVSAVNTTLGGTAIPTSLFTISGSNLGINIASLEPYISGSSSTIQHTLTITTTSAIVTIIAYKGSVHIVSVSVSSANIAPTANDFTYGTNIGNTARTFNWKTLSSAADANGDTLTATVGTNGTKGTFAISSDNVTYTPSAGKLGGDTATLHISDGHGGAKDIVVSVNSIDTRAPQVVAGTEAVSAFNTNSNFQADQRFDRIIPDAAHITNIQLVDNTGAIVSSDPSVNLIATIIGGTTVRITGMFPGGQAYDTAVRYDVQGSGISATQTYTSQYYPTF